MSWNTTTTKKVFSCTSFSLSFPPTRTKSRTHLVNIIFYASQSNSKLNLCKHLAASHQICANISLQGCVRIRPLAMQCISMSRYYLLFMLLLFTLIWSVFEYSNCVVACLNVVIVILAQYFICSQAHLIKWRLLVNELQEKLG